MRKRVLFVEDNDIVRQNYAELLTDEGFEVEAFPDRQAAFERAKESLPDLALLDISLDAERDGGFQLCAELRSLSARLPIIFLTSHDSEVDMISGMRLGADDYIVKDPDKLNYLVVRIEALLRRFEMLTNNERSGTVQPHPKFFVLDQLKIDKNKNLAYWKGQRVDLTLTQLWIVQDLAEHNGQVRNPEKLMVAAKITVEPNTVAAHIKSIRDRFKTIDSHFDCILTERGRGYRWVGSIK
jgi:two-component system OmpR family response regulator